jgi:CubicO group peptidase (beta-lactamase class C family)
MPAVRSSLTPLLVATVAAVGPPRPAQSQTTPWDQAVAAMDAYVASDRIVGSALVMIDDGRIVADHFTGFADRATGRAANRETIWHWGSITKTLTAVDLMQLDTIAAASLLDQPATRYVPELRRIHSDFGSMDQVTLRTLLSHSSGLQAGTWPWTRGQAWEPFEPTDWNQLVAMMPYMKLAFAPGSRYSYSNPGFVYVARAIQAITGDPWQGRIYKTLLVPLDMRASYFGSTPRQWRDDRSHNYAIDREGVHDRGPDFDPGITIPNGGWNAPVSDLARWIGFLAGSPDPARQADYDRLLPRTVLESMWQPVVRASDEEMMGLSFFLRQQGGHRLVGHTGTQANFRSFLWFDPDSHRGVLGVVNTSSDVDGAGSDQRYQQVMAAARAALVARP